MREKACEMIQYVNDKFERIILIKLLINDPDSHVRAKACEMIQYVQDSDEIVALIKE
ncbi:hypothetical protein KA405_00855 [Patescibacteria group bacterium]|nr:hypothetical protein [Patescibacteria group bacterium]